MAERERVEGHVRIGDGVAPTPAPPRRYLTVAWLLLLVLGAFFLFAAVSDVAADARIGIPSDHTSTFAHVAGVPWAHATHAVLGLTQYITLLEVAYAVHELVFGLLFLVIVAIPVRRGLRWAWWACWVPLLANLTYALTFWRHDATLLARSHIADIGLPLLLLLHLPVFFGWPNVSRGSGH